jgi:ubiquinone/menaquinone biosynthesis C-methylase UbiE
MMGEKVFEPGAVTYEGDLSSNYPIARMLSADTAETWAGVLRPFLTMLDRPTVLDLGCGTGRFSTLISDRFGATVVGIDPSMAMLRTAVRHAEAGKVQYAAAQAERLPFAAASCDVA